MYLYLTGSMACNIKFHTTSLLLVLQCFMCHISFVFLHERRIIVLKRTTYLNVVFICGYMACTIHKGRQRHILLPAQL